MSRNSSSGLASCRSVSVRSASEVGVVLVSTAEQQEGSSDGNFEQGSGLNRAEILVAHARDVQTAKEGAAACLGRVGQQLPASSSEEEVIQTRVGHDALEAMGLLPVRGFRLGEHADLEVASRVVQKPVFLLPLELRTDGSGDAPGPVAERLGHAERGNQELDVGVDVPVARLVFVLLSGNEQLHGSLETEGFPGEILPQAQVAEVLRFIVDLETGEELDPPDHLVRRRETLIANGNNVVAEIFTSNPQLIANAEALADRFKHDKMEDIRICIDAVLSAEKEPVYMVFMDVPTSVLGEVESLLPAVVSPTVSPVLDESWCSVSVVIKESELNVLAPRLLRLGVDGIVPVPVPKVFTQEMVGNAR